jgi:hypothetical protein
MPIASRMLLTTFAEKSVANLVRNSLSLALRRMRRSVAPTICRGMENSRLKGRVAGARAALRPRLNPSSTDSWTPARRKSRAVTQVPVAISDALTTASSSSFKFPGHGYAPSSFNASPLESLECGR